MSNSGFFGDLVKGIQDANAGHKEYNDVQEYRKTSKLFQNILKAAAQPGVDPAFTKMVQNINGATNFADMLKCASQSDISAQPFYLKGAVKMATFFAGYFNPNANAGYYIFQFRDNVVDYATKRGYCLASSTNSQISVSMRT